MPSAWGHTRLLETDWRLITQESHCFSCGSVNYATMMIINKNLIKPVLIRVSGCKEDLQIGGVVMLAELLQLQKYHDVALVGAGGKTTLINRLTESLRKKKKILVSSTTTFIKPTETMFDFIDVAYSEDYDLSSYEKTGIYLIGRGKNLKDLVMGLEIPDIERISAHFDQTIIECDFSNGRPLKGFREFEPEIPETTDVTIGIVDIQALGLQVNSKNIHHLDRYIELTGASIGSLVTIQDLVKIVENSKALFKNAKGKKVLYINKVEKAVDQALATTLLEALNVDNLDLILEGSLVDNRYDILYEGNY